MARGRWWTSRRAVAAVAAVAVAAALSLASVSSAATSAVTVQPGDSVDVECAQGAPISDGAQTATGETVSCGQAATTTTTAEVTTTEPTTTVPETTTTTAAPTTTTVPVPPSGCGFRTTMNPAAFCETFDQPTPTPGTRSGDLNGVLWGVSHASSFNNTGQHESFGWAASSQTSPCGPQTVAPETDVRICQGQMIESTNDSTGQTVLAAYPRQPFDFAGRTGTAEFDVSDNTQGVHSAWPDFVITDQPLPAPSASLSGVADNARNSVGVELAQVNCNVSLCGHGSNQDTCVGVSAVFDTSSYRYNNIGFTSTGCVKPSTAVGVNNHVEVQVGAAGLTVFMADAGNPASLKQVAHASFAVPLTRGLVWVEDVHYNAGKFNTEQTNTFSWDNVAFDGPVLPRDLGFDIPDANTSYGRAANGLPFANLGWLIPQGGALTLTVPDVHGTAAATAALLEFTYGEENAETFSIQVNGNPAISVPDPHNTSYVSQTIAVPVPLTEVHDGNNTISMRTSDGNGNAVGNFDLILAGAGGTVQP